MRTVIILLIAVFVPLSLGGYLPPQDNDYYDNNSYRSCSCDSQIASLTSRLDELERKQTEHFKREKRSSAGAPIAFTAYLSTYNYNMQIGQPIIYDTYLVNEGKAYDSTTGKFTAPLDGLYMFSFIIETKHSVDTAVQLLVDGVNTLDAVVEPRHNEQNLQGGNVGVLKLRAGQQVWVQVYNSGNQSLEGGSIYRFTTFTGVLLAEMEFQTPLLGVGK